jgi:hypothetical protein
MRNFNSFLLIIFSTVILFSCEKEEKITDNQHSEQLEILVNNFFIKPKQIVTIEVFNQSIDEESVQAMLGETEITIFKSSETNLIFTVPEIDEGFTTLNFTLANKQADLAFEIGSNEVNNPEIVVQNELLNPLNELQTDIDDLLAEGGLSQIQIESLNKSTQLLNQFQEKYQTLSEQEKLEVAKFYNVNPLFTTGIQGLENRNTSSSGYDCFKVNHHKVVRTTLAIIGFIHLLPELVATGPIGSVFALTGFVAGVYAAYNIISIAHKKLRNNCFFPVQTKLKDANGNTDNFNVYNGEYNNFKVKTKERLLIEDDIDNPNPIVAFTMDRIRVIKYRWQQLVNGITNIVNTTSNWFNTTLGNSSSNFDLNEYNLEDFPESSPEQEVDGRSEHISIEGLPSDVSANVSVTGNNTLNVRFDAPNTTLPRTVIGKVRYDDGDFSTLSEFQLSMQQAVDSIPIYENAVLGNWTVETLQYGDMNTLTLMPNGGGYYTVESGTTYNISWQIVKANGKYHLREDGFYHSAFESYRTLDVTLPENFLTYPVSTFLTYTQLPSQEPSAGRRYTKN